MLEAPLLVPFMSKLIILSLFIASVWSRSCPPDNQVEQMIDTASDILAGVSNLLKALGGDAETVRKPLHKLVKIGRDVPTLGSYLPYLQGLVLDDCTSSSRIEDLLARNLKLFRGITELTTSQTEYWNGLLSSDVQQLCRENFVESRLKILSAMKKWETFQNTQGETQKQIVEDLFLQECANNSCETALAALLSTVSGSGYYGCDFLELMHTADASWNRTQLATSVAYLVTLINQGLNILSFYYRSSTTNAYDAYEMVVGLYGETYVGALRRIEVYLGKPSVNSAAVLTLTPFNTGNIYDCLSEKFETVLVDLGSVPQRTLPATLTDIIIEAHPLINNPEKPLYFPNNFTGRVWLKQGSGSIKDLFRLYRSLTKSFEQKKIFPEYGIFGTELKVQSGIYSELNELPFWSAEPVDLGSINPPLGFCSESISVCGETIRRCQQVSK